MHTAPGFLMVIRQLVLTKIATYYSQNYASILGSSLMAAYLERQQISQQY